MKYRADIDGLRALAILPVLLFHAGLSLFSGGYVGVDIFFVISGFIISRTLLDDLEAGRFSILTFYERRIRRIFPALFFISLATWLVALLLLLPNDFKDFSKSLVASATFISNLYFWKFSGYFENSALLRPLLHTWSLSVEEQFYIFMPVVMLVIYRYGQKRWALVLLPAIFASFALSMYALKVAPTANFFLLPTRAWELLLGALLALVPLPVITRRWVNEALALLAIGLIGWAVFTFTEATPFPGPNALLPCIGAAILIYLGGHTTTLVGRVLALRPFVGIGLISYSLYLIHWPIAVFMRHATLRSPNAMEILLICVASIGLAILSWRYIEQPFRRPRQPAARRHVLLVGAITILATVILGGFGLFYKGFPQRFPDYVEVIPEKGKAWRNGECFFEEGQSFAKWNAKDCELTHGKGETVLLWGDSFAAHYIPGIVANQKRTPYRVLAYTYAGCPPVLSYYSYARPQCSTFNAGALKIIESQNVTRVIIAARWIDLQLRGLDSLRSTLDALAQRNIKVYVIGQSPMFPVNVHTIAYRKGKEGNNRWLNIIEPELNAKLKALSSGAHFIDPLPALCHGQQCDYRDQSDFLYTDYGHLSSAGSMRAVQRYLPL